MTTNVPFPVFSETGLLVPQESAILTGVIADYNVAFGGNLNPALETPQGQLAMSQTVALGQANDFWSWLINQVNPDYAVGIMQDAIGRIYFLDRKPATPTAVQCLCVGASGVTIPVGALAQDTAGNIYRCTQDGTIPVGGSITLSFACTVNGPTACPANTLTKIYRQIPGWDTINNAADGVSGTLVESRNEFEYRRRNSVALNAHGSLSSIYANVFNVADVIDVYAYENTTGITASVGHTSYSVAEHSIYIAVSGGDSSGIAHAIWEKKNDGSNTNGNVTVNVQDTSIDSTPYPTYPIKFQRPSSLAIKFAVSIVDDPSLPANISTLIKNAIIAAFSGADGGQRVRIASTVYASRFYAPVSLANSSVSIIEILVGTSSATLNSVASGIDQIPTVSAPDIAVTLI